MHLILTLLTYVTFSVALDLTTQWHPMETKNSEAIETKEEAYTVNGQRYDRIEYDGKFYYVRLQKSESDGADEDFSCESPARNNIPMRLTEAGVKVTKRTRLFIEGLIKKCQGSPQYGTHAVIDTGGIAGIAIEPTTKDGNEKKIFFDPSIFGAGFRSNF